MKRESINAYDMPGRVASYDADMDVMHPNRAKMVDVVLEFLPLPKDAAFTVLELGIGTGFFAKRLLEAYPAARVIGVDGAESMVEMAASRLGPMAERVDFRVGDLQELDRLIRTDEVPAAVLSSYALHHLDREEKLRVIRESVGYLQPDGWFVNADVLDADSPVIETRIQQLRIEGIIRRAASGDDRFADERATRRFLDDMEAREGDQPLTLWAALEVLRQAGLDDACVLWLEYREAVTAGRRSDSPSA